MAAPRTRHGSAHSRAKLSEDIVIAMRYRHARGGRFSGHQTESMAQRYNVAPLKSPSH